MKKDIEIPKVEGVYMAVVQEYNDIYKTNDWNAYLINDNDVALEMVLVVSKGYDRDRETSLMRHKLEKLPPKSYAKIEWMQDDVLALNNSFKVTFFEGGKMYDRNFIFSKNTINEKALRNIPLMHAKGILVQ
ncbi:hypothetical protein [Mangrovimonas aestuarii]|uniref:hypothetical protein n=1 Tax=Mangrovimonas aestuarii TaxID=3018443 RepID=UPI002379FF6B|nr:hypothetical protein [Mangrovimonas aestuarii]